MKDPPNGVDIALRDTDFRLETLPLAERTIMLAMDVSGSMRAEERLAAFLLNLVQRLQALAHPQLTLRNGGSAMQSRLASSTPH